MKESDVSSLDPVQGEVVDFINATGDSTQQQSDSMVDLLQAILRRWYIVVFCSVVLGGGGAAAILFLMPDKFDTRGTVLVSPVAAPIMYETSSAKGGGTYDTFKNTQAGVMTSDLILNRVADEVKDKQLIFFSPDINMLQTLRNMVARKDITVTPERSTEFLHIVMTTPFPSDAENLINAFLRSYEAVVKTDDMSSIDDRLSRLEVQRRTLEEQMRRQKARMRRMILS